MRAVRRLWPAEVCIPRPTAPMGVASFPGMDGNGVLAFGLPARCRGRDNRGCLFQFARHQGSPSGGARLMELGLPSLPGSGLLDVSAWFQSSTRRTLTPAQKIPAALRFRSKIVCSLFFPRTDFLVDVVPTSELVPKSVVGHEDRGVEGERVGGELVSGRFWRAASPIRAQVRRCRVHSGQWLHCDTHRLRPYAKLSTTQLFPSHPSRQAARSGKGLASFQAEFTQCTSTSIQYPAKHHFAGPAGQQEQGEHGMRCLLTCAGPAAGPPRLSPVCLVFFFGHLSTP
ncbi:uncharacterized protein B0H64DRAFT_117798 [Chaetomium fimeti]|uniref:Uncharacterized protein n=1 Tax=Chaetomium fimeti TaxID=1854472 RepID=A0AAE0HIB6_9PEZI|nr:hypothetical protein B0H64DRAFT_117798 [Chaetomium fimeti]